MQYNQLLYEESLSGLLIRTNEVYTTPGEIELTVYVGQNPTFELTGYYYFDSQGVNWYQTTGSKWILSNSNATNVGRSGSSYSRGAAQNLVDQIISNNKKVYENNLLCARFSSYLTSRQQEQVKQLQRRLVVRDQALQENSGLYNLKMSYPDGYINELPYLDRLMEGESGRIGVVISTTAMLVISAIVVVSLATSVYFAMKAWAKESESDVKFSDELTKTLLDKLSPEEYEQLRKETAGLITKAKLKSKLQAGGTLFKWVMLAVAGGFVFANRDKIFN